MGVDDQLQFGVTGLGTQVRENPGKPDDMFCVGLAHYQDKCWAAAADAFEYSLKRNPKYWVARLFLAEAQFLAKLAPEPPNAHFLAVAADLAPLSYYCSWYLTLLLESEQYTRARDSAFTVLSYNRELRVAHLVLSKVSEQPEVEIGRPHDFTVPFLRDSMSYTPDEPWLAPGPYALSCEVEIFSRTTGHVVVLTDPQERQQPPLRHFLRIVLPQVAKKYGINHYEARWIIREEGNLPVDKGFYEAEMKWLGRGPLQPVSWEVTAQRAEELTGYRYVWFPPPVSR